MDIINTDSQAYTVTAIPALADNYIWVISNHTNNLAAIVDPGASQPVFDYLTNNSLILCAILITHHHWDHTGGVPEILKKYSVPVYGPTLEAKNIVTHPLKEKDSCKIQDLGYRFTVLDIPGHTLGHIAYYNGGNKDLFSGDTLFAAGCGRVFEGTHVQMYESLGKLKQLPADTRVYCGHEYTYNNLRFASTVEADNLIINEQLQLTKNKSVTLPSTIELELQTNPFLRCKNPEDFTLLRTQKDTFK